MTISGLVQLSLAIMLILKDPPLRLFIERMSNPINNNNKRQIFCILSDLLFEL